MESTILFDKVIFGPVKSRRLGLSLGVNLLPVDRKICNYNCVYCECGLTRKVEQGNSGLPEAEKVNLLLR
ncbi:MAG: radical SAM protein, partial [bacterium]